MSHEIIRKKQVNVLQAMSDFISNTGLENVKTSYNSKAGSASITGSQNGIQYTTTLQRQQNGVIQTNSQFSNNLGKEALVSQVKELVSQGYKQRQIADMLGISQSLVSKYARL